MFKAELFFARILLPFLIGILLSYYFPSNTSLNIYGFLTTCSFSLLLINNVLYKRYNLYKFKGYTGVLIFFSFFCLGNLICLQNKDELKSDYFGHSRDKVLRAWVSNEPRQIGKILRFNLKVTRGYSDNFSQKLVGNLQLMVNLDSAKRIALRYGDEVLISADYKPIEKPRNPAEFDFSSFLASQNLYQQAFVSQNELIKTGKNIGNPIIAYAFNVRNEAVKRYRKLIKDDAAFSVASTLVLGYKADLDEDTRTNFANTGTMHALSVSGAHVGIIFIVLEFLLQFLNKRKSFIWLKAIVICLIIWNYALLTGLSPSVVRASIMLSIFIFAKGFTKNKNGYNILAFAAFLQLLINPFLILNVGFQLSYVAVFGLIYLQPKIHNWLHFKNKALKYIWSFMSLSLAAQVATFPLAIYYFHKFPIYFLLGNVFLSLPLIVMMYLGIIVLIPGFSFVAPVFEWVITSTNYVLHAISSLPFSVMDAIWISFLQFIILSVAITLAIYALAKFKKNFLIASLLLFIFYETLTLYQETENSRQNKIVFFSLKKNYAAAFITGRRAVVVSNLNSTDKSFQFAVKPALDKLQINQLDFVKLGSDTTFRNFAIAENQIHFNTYKILVLDTGLNQHTLKTTYLFNTIWMNNNPKHRLDSLSARVKFNTLIIDATNKSYNTKAYNQFGTSLGRKTIDLKTQQAFVVNLSEHNE